MFNKALIAAATAAFIGATAAPVTQAEAGSLNFSISFGKKSFKKSFKRKTLKRRGKASRKRASTNRRRANTTPRSRKTTRPTSQKCASGLKVQGVCMSKSYKRKLEAAQKEINEARLYRQAIKRCRIAGDKLAREGATSRTLKNATARCIGKVHQRFGY
ncbi:MAG: hypothetical protein AAFQ42_11385 [Pseudomonadota bacterium]